MVCFKIKYNSDWAVKCLSLVSIKSEQKGKISSTVIFLSHAKHTGGSSPFNKKEWVIEEWPMCIRDITVSSLLFVRRQVVQSFKFGNYLMQFVFRELIPLWLPKHQYMFVYTWFLRDELYSEVLYHQSVALP